jgi:hypothetical protein
MLKEFSYRRGAQNVGIALDLGPQHKLVTLHRMCFAKQIGAKSHVDTSAERFLKEPRRRGAVPCTSRSSLGLNRPEDQADNFAIINLLNIGVRALWWRRQSCESFPGRFRGGLPLQTPLSDAGILRRHCGGGAATLSDLCPHDNQGPLGGLRPCSPIFISR